MSRKLMPESGVLVPHVVMNRDAAVAGVFSVDGEKGAVNLTSKYLLITKYNTDATALDTRIDGIDSSITSINQAIQSINTSIGTKAAKGVNNDITELKALTTPITILQGGTGATTDTAARTNLKVDRFHQIATDTTLVRAGDGEGGKFRFTISSRTKVWGAYDEATAAWIPLPLEQGGTGAITLAAARVNLGVDKLEQSAGSTNIKYPTKNASLLLRDSDLTWGVWDTTGNAWKPLGVAQGGTGATNATDARANLDLGPTSSVNFGQLATKSVSDAAIASSGMLSFFCAGSTGTSRHYGRIYTETTNAGAGSQLTLHLRAVDGTNKYLVLTQEGNFTVPAELNAASIKATTSTILGNSFGSTFVATKGGGDFIRHEAVAGQGSYVLSKLDGANNWYIGRGSNNSDVLTWSSYITGTLVQVATDRFVCNKAMFATAFTPSSDERIKTNRVKMDNALWKVQQLQGYSSYTLNFENDYTFTTGGLLAQDVQKVMPAAVHKGTGRGIDKDGNVVEDVLSLDYNAVSGLLVEAIKELNNTVQAQQDRIDRLEDALTKLLAK